MVPGCSSHFVLCFLCRSGRAQHRHPPHPTSSKLSSREEEGESCRSALSLSLWERCQPPSRFSLRKLVPPSHTPGWDLSPCCYREADFSLLCVQGFCTQTYSHLQRLEKCQEIFEALQRYRDFLPLIRGPQFLHYSIVFIQAAFPWCNLSTHVSSLQKTYRSGKSRG